MNRRSDHRAAAFWLYGVVVLFALAILSFSLRSGTSSNTQSEEIAHAFAALAHKLGIVHPNLRFLTLLYPEHEGNLANLLVRKLAHLSEYAIFGVICTLSFRRIPNRAAAVFLNIAAGPLLALADEKFVQAYLSVGRTSSFRDVIVDSAGFFIGTAVTLLIRHALDAKRHACNGV